MLMLSIMEKSTVSTLSGEINKDHQNQTVLIQTETEGQDFEIESVYWLSYVFSDLHELTSAWLKTKVDSGCKSFRYVLSTVSLDKSHFTTAYLTICCS